MQPADEVGTDLLATCTRIDGAKGGMPSLWSPDLLGCGRTLDRGSRVSRISTLRRGAGIRLTSLVGLGASTRCIPLARVHGALKETGRESQRRRDLPSHVMVCLVIALGLYRELAVEEVLRRSIEGLKHLGACISGGDSWEVGSRRHASGWKACG